MNLTHVNCDCHCQQSCQSCHNSSPTTERSTSATAFHKEACAKRSSTCSHLHLSHFRFTVRRHQLCLPDNRVFSPICGHSRSVAGRHEGPSCCQGSRASTRRMAALARETPRRAPTTGPAPTPRSPKSRTDRGTWLPSKRATGGIPIRRGPAGTGRVHHRHSGRVRLGFVRGRVRERSGHHDQNATAGIAPAKTT